LVDALDAADDKRLVLLDAPVGYGKSALLAESLASGDGQRSFAWLSLEEADSDPTRLLAHLVASIRLHLPPADASSGLLVPMWGSGITETVVERLLDELGTITGPLVIALDDYHTLRGKRVLRLMELFLDGLPPTIQLVVATRADPALPLGRLRATEAMFELRAKDLRFDEAEASAMLEASGISLPQNAVADLVERTEGWPAGLYLATLSLRSERDPEGFVRRFAGTHRHVADYLSEEVFQRQRSDTRAFLVRTSVLGRMCGRLCDVVLGTSGSQRMLEDLEHSNLFVVSLDNAREWYRYHHLFGEVLRAELRRSEPSGGAKILRRASEWFESEGLPEEAVHCALAARDPNLAGTLIARHWFELFSVGRVETVRRWLDDLGEEAIAALPATALVAGWVAALVGEPESMERWLAVAEEGSDVGSHAEALGSIESGAAIVRGLFGFRGLRERSGDLVRAWELEPERSEWRPLLLWGLGHVALLAGDPAAAEGRFEEALCLSPSLDPISQVIVLAALSITKTELGRHREAMSVAQRAESIVETWGLGTDTRSSGVPLAVGVALVAAGELGAGREAMERALDLRRSSGRLSPWPTLEVLLALAPVRFTLGDVAGAKDLLGEARLILAGLDDAGVLPQRLEEEERRVRRSDRTPAIGETLTDRETAILRLFPTQLSQREIGGELYLSLNTVKTHSRAIYRKLGVSSRQQAIERARELELL